MKYLVVLTSLLAASRATPITPGYGPPAAVPIQTVDIAVPAPPVVAPAAGVVEVRRAVTPVGVATRSFVRNIASPVPLPLARAAPLAAPTPLAPSPFARAFPAAPVLPRALPSALPLAARAPLAPTPLVAGAPLAPAPLAAGAPVAPVPLAGAPIAPVPLARAGPLAGAPLPLVRSPVAALNPVPLAAAPAVANTQFHAQDELGGFNFGYQNAESGRQEVRTPDGVTRGSYSYVDANGIPQTVNYIADPVNGFRVQATNLPVAPVAAGPVAVAAPNAALPAVVVDTPEVAAAKADFQLAFDAAVAQAEAEAAAEIAEEIVTPVTLRVVNDRKKRSPIAPGYGVPAAPVVVAEPVAPVVVATPPVQVGVVETRRVIPVGPAPVLPTAVRAAAPIVPVPAVRAAAPLLPTAALPAAPLPAALPAVRAASPLGLTPVGPAPVVPGPVRTIPLAATAQVRTPLTAGVATSQFHAQDELGGATFGYQGLTSGRQETRTADGVVRGAYNYVDANGVVQTVEYIADALGFRVAATNLPVAPVA